MNNKEAFALYGNIIFTSSADKFDVYPNHYLVCCNGAAEGIYPQLPERLSGIRVMDYKNRLIIPGLCDSHVHAPQYPFRGLGMDMELLDWLDNHAFAEEIRYSDLAYAEKAYSIFADDLRKSFTSRACIFGTVHVPATELLMDRLEETGLITYAGKVSMDRNCPEQLRDCDETLYTVEKWINDSLSRFRNTKPVITPRFVPSCTDKLMHGLGKLAEKYNIPVQSHLSENISEGKFVKELCPDTECYADAYDIHGLFGRVPTVMAHCVHCPEKERRMLADKGILVAHCPSSNANLSSGIAPIRQYLDESIKISLGTDIAAGYDISVFRAMSDAIQMSKLRSFYSDGKENPLTCPQVFFMGTKGAETLFGKVGSFEKGYAFDALVLDDSGIRAPRDYSPAERIERVIYLSDKVRLEAKFTDGRMIDLS